MEVGGGVRKIEARGGGGGGEHMKSKKFIW